MLHLQILYITFALQNIREKNYERLAHLPGTPNLYTYEIAMSSQLSEVGHTNRPMNQRSAAAADC